MTNTVELERSPVPEFHKVTFGTLLNAVRLGWRDFLRSFRCGIFFGGFYVICAWIMAMVTVKTGETYWLVLAAFGFPLFAPFAAVGLYEISHRLTEGTPIKTKEILGVVYRQRDRQIPSISAIIIFIFLFWFFIAHMIFALFLGFSTMTNISSSLEVFFTPNGLSMLGIGTLVGAVLAFFVFSITVITLPLLLDRELDFVTAMLTSIGFVKDNLFMMLIWGAMISLTWFAAMVPWFLGVLIVLPVFGHASWHLYKTTVIEGT